MIKATFYATISLPKATKKEGIPITQQKTIARIRAFNRFYTVVQGMLDRQFLGSAFSVTETSMLYELHRAQGCQARDLAEHLHLDKGYVSRLLASFARRGIVAKSPDPRDGRATVLTLSDHGEACTQELIHRTNQAIGGLIAPLSAAEREALCQAMDTITRLLGQGDGAGEEVAL